MKKLLLVLILVFSNANAATVEEICKPNYTSNIRPSSYWVNKVKVRLLKEQGLVGNISNYQLDHIVPLGLNGAPKDLSNIQMQPLEIALIKDKDETRLHKEVCSGKKTLSEAQLELSKKWGK